MSGETDFSRALINAAADGALVLTANNRLARHLRSLHDERMLASGLSAWHTPFILSADEWLRKVLAEFGEGWRLLTPAAAQRLWEEVVEADTGDSPLGLLQVPASARRAREAHELLADYQAEAQFSELTEDHRAFSRWRERFRKACAAGDWIDPAERADRVCAAVAASRLPLPKSISIAGFEELPPWLHRIAAAARERGCRVLEAPPATEPVGDIELLACRDASDEVRRAACWARQLLQAGEGSVGVVVPDLAHYQSLIERIFREEIAPSSLLSLSGADNDLELTLGAPLAQQGPVAAALEFLSVGPQASLDVVSFLLRTPYLGGAVSESSGRARFEWSLRALRSESFSLASLERLAGSAATPASPEPTGQLRILRRVFSTLHDACRDAERQLPGTWAERFERLLQELGWPGERPLDSRDFQVVKTWREKLLAQFSSLDSVCRPLRRGEAIAQLRRLAGDLPFKAETPQSALQVCGVLEAGGLHFDHLWVIGLHEDAWPPAPRPNPFIPVQLQVACGMPHADARREAEFSRRVTARLQASAGSVVFSYPLQQGDTPLRPSPLISGFETRALLSIPSHSPHKRIRAESPGLQAISDAVGPPLAEGEVAQGGTAILKDQALCPFRAFARHRLAAKSLEQPAVGVDAATRGTLIHKTLELFWAETLSHAELCRLSEAELRERVARSCDGALLAQYPPGRPQPPASLLDIERRRLQLLAEEWLTCVERERAPFTNAEREQEHLESFGGLSFRTKIDRIDTLDDGRCIIIDYKTGRVDLDDLLGERLLEPQLPIYGIGLGGSRLAAVAVGSLRRGECAFKAVARDDDILPRTNALAGSRIAEKHDLEGWEDLLERWRTRLDALGHAFAEGDAAVDPVDPQKACRNCDLAPLCRIDENPLLHAEEGGAT